MGIREGGARCGGSSHNPHYMETRKNTLTLEFTASVDNLMKMYL